MPHTTRDDIESSAPRPERLRCRRCRPGPLLVTSTAVRSYTSKRTCPEAECIYATLMRRCCDIAQQFLDHCNADLAVCDKALLQVCEASAALPEDEITQVRSETIRW